MHQRKSIGSAEVVSATCRAWLRIRGYNRATKSQAPVDRCTRTGLLPLLPSGPGGFHRIALRGTSARPTASYHLVTLDWMPRARLANAGMEPRNARIKGFHAFP